MNYTNILDKFNRGKKQRFFIVSGDEGLGKTTAALSRSVFLKDNYCIRENENILIISDEDLDESLESIKNESGRDNTFFSFLNNNNIEICSKKQLINRYFKNIRQSEECLNKRLCEDDVVREIILDGISHLRQLEKNMNKIIVSQNIDFLFDEILYIKELGINSIDEYQQLSRKKRGYAVRRNSKSRESIYILYRWYCDYMDKSGLIDLVDEFNLVYDYARKVDYAHIIIDNVENLTIKELTFIRSLLGELTYSNFILIKDTNKAITENPWKDYFKRNKDVSYFDDNKYKVINCNTIVVKRKLEATYEIISDIEKDKDTGIDKEKSDISKNIEILDSENTNNMENIMSESSQVSKNSDYIETYKYVDFKHNVSHEFAIDTSSYDEVILNPDTTSEIIRNDEINKVPVYNEIAAGQPISINDEVEGVFNLPIYWLKGVQQPFILKIKGDSMINIDIEDGDYVVINKQTMASHNEIVAVSIDGEATLKRLWLKGAKAVLMPENSKYSPIEITEDNAYIIGKAVGLIKSIH